MLRYPPRTVGKVLGAAQFQATGYTGVYAPSPSTLGTLEGMDSIPIVTPDVKPQPVADMTSILTGLAEGLKVDQTEKFAPFGLFGKQDVGGRLGIDQPVKEIVTETPITVPIVVPVETIMQEQPLPFLVAPPFGAPPIYPILFPHASRKKRKKRKAPKRLWKDFIKEILHQLNITTKGLKLWKMA